ncbi:MULTISPECIES: hypothetical protein [Microbacterium]|uniref:hypothetical protein n=1 Tax=Microbacterium TaxID=33882 RepID=UPI002780A010|nr:MULTISPECIES: hypothetical protein [Microbacterium]MDQ1083339.1 hypothetical protein [Microbacterium sp. SORGH_AS_0344]MDQ1171381.1 hypothetical protein [Microbacterium proteolyticum]
MVGPGEESNPRNWGGGMSPDFDLEAQCRESFFIGRDLEDSRFIGHVGGAPLEKEDMDPARFILRSARVLHHDKLAVKDAAARTGTAGRLR